MRGVQLDSELLMDFEYKVVAIILNPTYISEPVVGVPAAEEGSLPD